MTPARIMRRSGTPGTLSSVFSKAEEIELMELHGEEVHFSPTAFVFENFAGLPKIISVRLISLNFT